MNKKIIFSAVFLAFTCPVNAAWEVRSIEAIANSVSWTTDINDSGIMVGEIKNNPFTPYYDTSGKVTGYGYSSLPPSHPFMTGENGIGIKILDIEGRAEAINNTGQVIGKSSTGTVFMTGPNGEGLTYLDYARDAYDINNLGQIVGVTKTGHGFITDPNGIGMTDLGPVVARGVNDSGQVVGWFNIGGDIRSQHAFITGPNGFGMTDLGAPNGFSSFAYDINNSGQVVGFYAFIELFELSVNGLYDPRAFMTDANGTNIRTISTNWSAAFGINDLGQVVTTNNLLCDHCYPGDGYSFLVDHGAVTNINNQFSPYELAGFNPVAINNNGQIAGTGFRWGSTSPEGWRAFMVTSDTSSPTPVPEPSTYAMLLAGLGLIGFMVRRRKNSAM